MEDFKKQARKKWQKKYNAVSLKLKAAIFAEAKENEAHIFNSGNLGFFYKHVNSRKSHKSGIAPLKNQLGKIIVTDFEKAELLNEAFVANCTMDNGYIPPLPAESADRLSTRPSLAEVNFTVTMLLQCMSKLKNKLSASPDGIPPIFFQKFD